MKDYNNIPDQLSAISWQLKRIADALENMNESKTEDKPAKVNLEDSTVLRKHINSF